MNKIKELRHMRGLLQTDLARILKVSQSALSNWEGGRRDPDTKSLIKLAEYFGVSIDYLVGRDAQMPPTNPQRADNLTEGEVALLDAYRAADERARSIVDLTLEPFMKKGDESQVG